MLYDTARACRSLERGPSIPRFLKTNRVIGTAIGCIDERALSHNQPTGARDVMYTVDFPCEEKTTSEYNNRTNPLLGLGVLAFITRRFPSQRGDKLHR